MGSEPIRDWRAFHASWSHLSLIASAVLFFLVYALMCGRASGSLSSHGPRIVHDAIVRQLADETGLEDSLNAKAIFARKRLADAVKVRTFDRPSFLRLLWPGWNFRVVTEVDTPLGPRTYEARMLRTMSKRGRTWTLLSLERIDA